MFRVNRYHAQRRAGKRRADSDQAAIGDGQPRNIAGEEIETKRVGPGVPVGDDGFAAATKSQPGIPRALVDLGRIHLNVPGKHIAPRWATSGDLVRSAEVANDA